MGPNGLQCSPTAVTVLPTRKVHLLSPLIPSIDLLKYIRTLFPPSRDYQVFLHRCLPPPFTFPRGSHDVGNAGSLPSSTHARPSSSPTRSDFMLRADPCNLDSKGERLPGSFICLSTLHLLLIRWADSPGVIRGELISSLDWDL